MQIPGTIDPPRKLRANELAVLEKLLSIDFPGVEELRPQLPFARVGQEDADGNPTIGFVVDRAHAPKAEMDDGPAIDAIAPAVGSDRPIWILLHVWDGYLGELEVVPPEDDALPMPEPQVLMCAPGRNPGGKCEGNHGGYTEPRDG